MFLYFEKAFDSIEWNFISRCLEVFGFSVTLRKWVSILYTDVSSHVSNNGLHSDFLHGMPAGQAVSRFRSGIFFFLRRSHKSTN